jgi:hypothetical protein
MQLNKSWYSHYQRAHLCLQNLNHPTPRLIHQLAGNDYTKIYSNARAFAALKADGSIKAWGDPSFGGASEGGKGRPS